MSKNLNDASTPHLADACMRAGVAVRCAPSELQPLSPGMRCSGRVKPVRHTGSVDVFLEAFERSSPGDVLVVDNGGRRDEGCIGDLVTLEAKLAGIAGIIIWGTHRDTVELLEIGLPVFSLGTFPAGPQRLDPRSPDALKSAQICQWLVSTDDIVFADADGVLFVPQADVSKITSVAQSIRNTERQHAELMRAGKSFRTQIQFDNYLAKRVSDSGFDFRRHLREIGGSIEE